jgi:hypothetical protein
MVQSAHSRRGLGLVLHTEQDMPNTDAEGDWQTWFERVWEYREEVLYPSLFGERRRGIFTVQHEMLTSVFKQDSIDPRWLTHGVIEFEPTPERASWLYVTSGMSNDWEAERPDPSTPSGLGCEFVFETTGQFEWAILRLLHLMTFQILICHGRYERREPMGDFDRIPLRNSISPEPSVLTYLMLAPPVSIPREALLESGAFEFYQVVGISEAEAAYARSHDGPALLERLMANSYFPVTDPNRTEVPTEDL